MKYLDKKERKKGGAGAGSCSIRSKGGHVARGTEDFFSVQRGTWEMGKVIDSDHHHNKGGCSRLKPPINSEPPNREGSMKGSQESGY